MNKTAILLILAAVVGIASCKKSDNNNAATTPSAVNYSYSFTDQFSNDSNGWIKINVANNMNINTGNGYLYFAYHPVIGNTSAPFTDTVNPAFDTKNDFAIQASIASDNAFGIAFGTTAKGGGYSFEVNLNGYFALFYQGDSTLPRTPVFNWSYTTAAITGSSSFNKLEIDQTAGEWYAYINGVQLFTIPARPLAGSTIGFTAEANTNGTADYITVKWN